MYRVPTTMATIDEELTLMEKDVRQLKIEYEQYFGGGRSRPPSDIEWRIDQVVKRYGERNAQMNFAQRFRYNSLAQTYAKYRAIFRKRLKQKEEGFEVRHYGAAAKAIAAERATRRTATSRETAVAAFAPSLDPVRERVKTKKLYEAFRDAKETAGESTRQLTAEAFQDFLRRKAHELRDKTGKGTIEFVVSIENGRTRLKARVQNGAKSK
jgi:hypothetical protein